MKTNQRNMTQINVVRKLCMNVRTGAVCFQSIYTFLGGCFMRWSNDNVELAIPLLTKLFFVLSFYFGARIESAWQKKWESYKKNSDEIECNTRIEYSVAL